MKAMKDLSRIYKLAVKNTCNAYEVTEFDSVSLLDKFIRFADVSNNSIYTYTKGIRQFINYITHMNITQPTRDNVIEFKKYLEHNNYSANTIATYLTAIKDFSHGLRARGFILISRSESKHLDSRRALRKTVSQVLR